MLFKQIKAKVLPLIPSDENVSINETIHDCFFLPPIAKYNFHIFPRCFVRHRFVLEKEKPYKASCEGKMDGEGFSYNLAY